MAWQTSSTARLRSCSSVSRALSAWSSFSAWARRINSLVLSSCVRARIKAKVGALGSLVEFALQGRAAVELLGEHAQAYASQVDFADADRAVDVFQLRPSLAQIGDEGDVSRFGSSNWPESPCL